MSASTIRILMAEDVKSDAELAARELKRAGLCFTHRIVDREEQFVTALGEFAPDVILSDFSMPQFDGMAALTIARERRPHTPFIFVSGTIGEEYAIRALKSGATDYVLKTNLVRLPVAVQRALDEAKQQETLRQSEGLKVAILDSSLDALVTIDESGNIVEFNRAAEAMFGIARSEALGKPMAQLIIPPRDREAHGRGFERCLATGEGPIFGKRLELEAIRADGTEFPVELAVVPIASLSKRMFTGFIRDITERKQAEARIRHLNRVYAVLSGINALIVRVRDRKELFREACRIAVESGGFRKAWIGTIERDSHAVRVVAAHGADAQFFEKLEALLNEDGAHGRGVVASAVQRREPVVSNDLEDDRRVLGAQNAAATGSRSLVVLPLLVGNDMAAVLVLHADVSGFFDDEEMKLLRELAGDISFAMEHIQKSEQVEYLAYYDPLTGLANRSLFLERLGQKIIDAGSVERKVAVWIVDIERFRTINDAFGRQAGDQLLQQVSQRMRTAGRDVMGLARVGGDQLAVMSDGAQHEDAVARLTERAMKLVLEQPYRVVDQELRVSARVGIAMFPSDGKDAEALLRNAEAALKKAKTTGERYLFFAHEMTDRIHEKLSLENKLRQALEKDEFVLHYQPKVELESRNMVGLEALIRWQSPELGLVPPVRFIALLEETGLILQVGDWALTRAALDLREWLGLGLVVPPIAVNVSAVQLRQRDFVDVVRKALKHVPLPAALDLEITESLIMQDVEANIEKLNALRKHGVNIAIDDFGTGYSSLGYLAKLPVQSLKIDRSFIVAMENDPNAMTLVSTIIQLAHSLHLKVIAEGVETEEQAKFLRLLRCDEMQGYLFSKPMPKEALAELLRKAPSAVRAAAGRR